DLGRPAGGRPGTGVPGHRRTPPGPTVRSDPAHPLRHVGGSAACPWSPGTAKSAPHPATTVSRRGAEAEPLRFRQDHGAAATTPASLVSVLRWAKRLVVGRPMRSERLGETLLPKKLALPVFCSDPLSSNAYATEEILLGLSLGGLALLHLTSWVGLAVIVLLAVVVASYRQTCYAYPNGGGAYAVSRANLGTNAALVAASALLVDYVLTVAVSVAAGVANIVSAFPVLGPYAVPLCIGMVAVLGIVNLRGVKESGTVFAIPTYGFIAMVFAMLGWAVLRAFSGHTPVAESAGYRITAQHSATGLLLVAIVLRAFSQGCTALTGVEAVSNGVPNFKAPKSRNAANTLSIMGVITIAMFAGITILALAARVHVTDIPANLVGAPPGNQQRTV